MIIQCTNCLAKFKFNEERLAEGPKKVRCTKCKQVFTVMPPGSEPAAGEIGAVKPTASRVPTDYTLNRSATGEQKLEDSRRSVTANDLLQTPLRKKTGEAPAAAGARKKPLTGSMPIPKSVAQASKAGQTPAFTTLTSITAQGDTPTASQTPPLPAGGRIESTHVNRNPSPPKPEGWSEQQNRTHGIPAAAIDPTQLERPEDGEQNRINDELYKQRQQGMDLPPDMAVLKEIDFNKTGVTANGTLELEDIREFEYGGDSAKVAARKLAKLKVKPLSGVREANAPNPTNYSGAASWFVTLIFSVLILGMLAIAGLGLVMGDTFNISHFTTPQKFISDLQGAPPSDVQTSGD